MSASTSLLIPKRFQKSIYLELVSALREAEEREEELAEEREAKVHDKKNNKSKDREGSEGKDRWSGRLGRRRKTSKKQEKTPTKTPPVQASNCETGVLASFSDITQTSAPPNREPEKSTLYEWYHGPTYFYTLKIAKGELSPTLLETTTDLEAKIEDLREYRILRKMEKLNLDIKFPRLHGFVALGNSKTEVMGLLLENIETPTPLTKLLKSSVDEEKRRVWSKKSAEYISLLHDNDIIWGDAKADNFMVDAHDELWIIDFGGSYTEGWIDPEISETLEGDDMGLEKIQLALEDPDKNTVDLGLVDEEEDEVEAEVSEQSSNVKETASTLFVTEKSAGEEVTRTEREEKGDR
ncbi:unnamed protein product [Alternaria alternata]